MSIFSQKKQKSSQQDRKIQERPKLFVLATKPSVPNLPQTTEWTLELVIPPETAEVESPADSAKSATPAQRLSNILRKPHETHTEAAPVAEEAEDGTPPPASKHSYFSRLHHTTSETDTPSDVILRIFLTSFPSAITADSTDHEDLTQKFSEALEPVHLTSDSGSWLRQALYSLQVAEIIPPLSHGLDVNKFMSFAAAYFAQYLQETPTSGPNDIKTVNYSNILQQNSRLKQRLHSDATDYAVVNDPGVGEVELGDEEDLWTLPVRGKPTKQDKSWGGFWLSHGPMSDVSRDGSRRGSKQGEPGGGRDPYGGLM